MSTDRLTATAPMGARARRAGRRTLAGTAAAAMLLAALASMSCGRQEPAAREFADADSPQELVNAVAGLVPRIERLSGLDRTGPLRMRWQTPDGSRRYVEQRLEQELPADRLDAIRRAYVALGLLPDTLDLRALLLDLYTEQVLGYYDPREETLYVLRGPDIGELRPVIIHELVHALQDQHADLDALVAQERGNDRQTAAHAALEGHAMVVMFAVLAELATRRQLDPTELPNPADELGAGLTAQDAAFPVIARAPRIIRETLLFPYVHGSDFVHRLWSSRRPLDRYPAPLDSLLPQSTAQVLQPVDRFIERRSDPVELRFDVPAGWQALHDDTFGQLETAIFLAVHSGDAARPAAEGWVGDRYVLLAPAADTAGAHAAGPAGDRGRREVLLWTSAWQSAAEADRFAAAARDALAARDAGRRAEVRRIELDGHPAVRIRDAAADSDPALLPDPSVRIAPPPPAAGAAGAAGATGSR